jgi:hypothetical protein
VDEGKHSFEKEGKNNINKPEVIWCLLQTAQGFPWLLARFLKKLTDQCHLWVDELFKLSVNLHSETFASIHAIARNERIVIVLRSGQSDSIYNSLTLQGYI